MDQEIVSEQKYLTQNLFIWFCQNEMKTNLSKCYMLLSTNKAFNFVISEIAIPNLHSKMLLGVTFGNKLDLKNISTKSVKEC